MSKGDNPSLVFGGSWRQPSHAHQFSQFTI